MSIDPTSGPRPKTHGRHFIRNELTPQQAKTEAIRMLRERELSPRADQAVDILAIAGALTVSQIQRVTALQLRTLQKYHSLHILDRVSLDTQIIMDLNIADNLTRSQDLRVYTLGVIGLEYARLRLGKDLLPSNYASLAVGGGGTRVLHDIVVAEIVLRLSGYARAHGFLPTWRSKYEATVHDENGSPALEPDAMLSVKKDGKYWHYFVEFHNEDHSTRTGQKVDRYEAVRVAGRWQNELEIETFPAVLIVFRHRAVIEGYKTVLTDGNGQPRPDIRNQYLGLGLQAILEDKLERWGDIRRGKPANLLPEVVEAEN